MKTLFYAALSSSILFAITMAIIIFSPSPLNLGNEQADRLVQRIQEKAKGKVSEFQEWNKETHRLKRQRQRSIDDLCNEESPCLPKQPTDKATGS